MSHITFQEATTTFEAIVASLPLGDVRSNKLLEKMQEYFVNPACPYIECAYCYTQERRSIENSSLGAAE